MASTALSGDEITEYYDTDVKVAQDAKKLADTLKSSKYAVVYTGAGISTSSGISDFRGPQGVWTLRAQGRAHVSKRNIKMPTKTHMAIKKLIDEGIVKYLVSQNTDGLHVRSGVPMDKIAELHGNTNKEYCKKCGRKYFRDFHTRSANGVHEHETGRYCACGGKLYDSIINFGESLPEEDLSNAIMNSRMSDCSIVLGTSLRVSPACNLPFMNKSNRNHCIVNLQKTPYDSVSNIVCHTETDHFMQLVIKELGLEIPDFIFKFSFTALLFTTQKKIKISQPSTDLSDLLLQMTLTDVNNNTTNISLRDKDKMEADLKSYEDGDEIQLKIVLNLLIPFTGFIKIKESSEIQIELNTFKNTFTYKLT
jgi:NAD+-dependent protein deacetylase sirtuin 6